MAQRDGMRQRFLELLGFSTPRAVVIDLVLILAVLAFVPTELLVYSPVKCVFKNVLFPLLFRGSCPTSGPFAGCDCPACGMTRGMSRLLHGDLAGAWAYNPLVFVVAALMVVLLIVNGVRWARKGQGT